MIAIYGGTFNPITMAHKKIVEKLLTIEKVTEVLVLPLSDKYEKSGLISEKHRLNMVKLCFENMQNVKISTLDYEADHQLTTVEYMEILREQLNDEVAFVMGADNLIDLHNWNGAEEILQKYFSIAINRNNSNMKKIIEDDEILKKYSEKIILVEEGVGDEYENMSATIVRNKILSKDFNNITFYICEKVLEYIKENGLYLLEK